MVFGRSRRGKLRLGDSPDDIRLKVARWTRAWNLSQLQRKSALFADAAPNSDDEQDDFAYALNARVVSSRPDAWAARPPSTMQTAINEDGTIKRDVELLLFGMWLFGDDVFGVDAKPGRPADDVVAFKVVGAALSIFWRREWLRKQVAVSLKKPRASLGITRTDLRDEWWLLFGEEKGADWFKSRRVTARNRLASYLSQLKAQPKPEDVKRGRSSPGLTKVVYLLESSEKNATTVSARKKASLPTGSTST